VNDTPGERVKHWTSGARMYFEIGESENVMIEFYHTFIVVILLGVFKYCINPANKAVRIERL
jgi:hypothetical protein